jgi:hypothetical protein
MHRIIEALKSTIFKGDRSQAEEVGSQQIVWSFLQGRERATLVLDQSGELASQLRQVLGHKSSNNEVVDANLHPIPTLDARVEITDH